MNSASSATQKTRKENEEQEKIEELRKRLKNELNPELASDDNMFLRFLRARDHNVKQAEEMLRNHIQWRKKYDIDNIDKYEFPEVAFKYYEMPSFGFDKSGCPVRYTINGNFDFPAIAKTMKYEDFIKSFSKIFYEDEMAMKEQSKKLGRVIDQWIHIMNFENFSFVKATDKACLKYVTRMMVDYDNNYPERLKNAYVINASSYFTLLFNIVKPLISSKTLSKSYVFGKEGWKEELLKIMNADQLPAFLGGTKTDPDGNPMCLTFMNHPGTVPKSYYFRNENRRLCNQPGVQKAQISRRSKHRVILDVKEPGSMLEWQFESESHDIGFGLYYQTYDERSTDKNPKELVPKQRFDAQIASEGGLFQCQLPGKYILIFDNSYSFLRRKKIFYKATVKEPSGNKTFLI